MAIKSSAKMTKLLLAILMAISFVVPAHTKSIMCSTNPPPKYKGTCFWAPSLWYCKGKELASWKTYQKLLTMDATEDNLKFYANVLFLPFDDLSGSGYHHEDVVSQIEQYNVDIECIKENLLNAYCNVVFLGSAETWIGWIPYMEPKWPEIVDAITAEALNKILKAIPSIPTSVFKAFAGIRSMPEIADNYTET